jgi:GTP cyclohydrolase I
MSRLFLRVQEGLESGPLDAGLLLRILEHMLRSHADLATEAHLALSFEWLTKRPALASGHAGWRSYPVTLEGSLTPRGAVVRVGATVSYSSTCPCSAALARQLIQEAFLARFGQHESIAREDLHTWLGSAEAICATPHSQRSLARALIELATPEVGPGLAELVDLLEAALGTPVQAAVKREDEQAFALLNGQNPMFCEDAGRRIKRALEDDPRIRDYKVRCEHQESLHPHDAVSVVTKGLPGGLRE